MVIVSVPLRIKSSTSSSAVAYELSLKLVMATEEATAYKLVVKVVTSVDLGSVDNTCIVASLQVTTR